MSLEIKCDIVCDNCKLTYIGEPVTKATQAHGVVWRTWIKAERDGWVKLNRGRYHVQAHYCPNCADKPMKPIPNKKRGPFMKG